MEELGIIVAPNGEYKSFGKWKVRSDRQIQNDNDWHTTSFMKQVYSCEWFQKLNIPYDKTKELQNQLDLFARNGCIIIANAKENSNSIGETRLVITVPNSITNEQILFMNLRRDKLTEFEDGHYSFIDILDVDQDYYITNSFYHITDFYQYLDTIKENRIHH